MKLMWEKYGKTEVAYKIEDIESTLKEYAGGEFASTFFENHIYNSKMPDYKQLFSSVGIKLNKEEDNYFGASLKETESGLEISRNTFKASPAYNAGLTSGDKILSLNGTEVQTTKDLDEIIQEFTEEKIEVKFERFGKQKITEVKLGKNPAYTISLDENASKEALKNRENWLESK
ncbi:PDZ domain-containing protein [Christiangramia sp.]|uniref:PDZ domain-containing protein n=1 Tax=Christiangramia sp. TaxID=1931228 RepID=UPI00345C2939